MNKKAFTLVELMVVVAVIAILATALLVGLGKARKKARDSRRLSDAKQVQNLLELYYAKVGNYPAGGYSNMVNELVSEGIVSNENQVPSDPLGGSDYRYLYASCGSNSQDYIMGVHLEEPSNKIMNQSVPFSECDNPNGDQIDCGNDGWYCMYY